MPTKNKVLFYLGWLIVAILLLYFGNGALDYYNERARDTFTLSGPIWAWTIVSFVYGLHLGLLDGLPKSFKIDYPLFIIVIPSFLLLICPVVSLYMNIEIKGLYVFIMNHANIAIFGLVCGMSLVRSITVRSI